MDKRSLSERNICTKFIVPALQQAGWYVQVQVPEDVTMLCLPTFDRIGAPSEFKQAFGAKMGFGHALRDLEPVLSG